MNLEEQLRLLLAQKQGDGCGRFTYRAARPIVIGHAVEARIMPAFFTSILIFSCYYYFLDSRDSAQFEYQVHIISWGTSSNEDQGFKQRCVDLQRNS